MFLPSGSTKIVFEDDGGGDTASSLPDILSLARILHRSIYHTYLRYWLFNYHSHEWLEHISQRTETILYDFLLKMLMEVFLKKCYGNVC